MSILIIAAMMLLPSASILAQEGDSVRSGNLVYLENPDRVQANEYYEQGEYEKAIPAYERAFSAGEIRRMDVFRHIDCLIELDRYDRALEMLEALAQVIPDEAIVWFDLGLVHSRCERHHNALACFRRAAEMEPEWPEAWHAVGLTELFLGHLDEAYAVVEILAPLDETMGLELLEAVIEEEEYRNDPAEK